MVKQTNAVGVKLVYPGTGSAEGFTYVPQARTTNKPTPTLTCTNRIKTNSWGVSAVAGGLFYLHGQAHEYSSQSCPCYMWRLMVSSLQTPLFLHPCALCRSPVLFRTVVDACNLFLVASVTSSIESPCLERMGFVS